MLNEVAYQHHGDLAVGLYKLSALPSLIGFGLRYSTFECGLNWCFTGISDSFKAS
jgi:hypothetical protein